MTPFSRVKGRAVVLALDNVDTDQIMPARFLRKPRGAGYGNFLFHDLRFDSHGRPRPESPLPASGELPVVLVAGDNFGCGSSREGAVYALVDYGVRVVVSTRIADIFRNNAVRNGLLPLELPAADAAALHDALEAQPQSPVMVDLETRTLQVGDGAALGFAIDASSRDRLLRGLDDTDETLARLDEIARFEKAYDARRPWARPRRPFVRRDLPQAR